MLLWAQAALNSPELAWPLSLGVTAFLTFLGVATFASMRQEHRNAELKHAETLRRLELGIPEPPRDRSWPLALVCIAIGLGVPTVAFGATLIAYLNKANVQDEIWIAPGVVSIVSVALGGGLAKRLLRVSASDGNVARDAARAPKFASDPDAFDVAGRRG